MSDISRLDARCFSDVRKLDKVPEISLHEVSTLAKVEPGQISGELLQFDVHYDDYKTPLQEQDSSVSFSNRSGEERLRRVHGV